MRDRVRTVSDRSRFGKRRICAATGAPLPHWARKAACSLAQRQARQGRQDGGASKRGVRAISDPHRKRADDANPSTSLLRFLFPAQIIFSYQKQRREYGRHPSFKDQNATVSFCATRAASCVRSHQRRETSRTRADARPLARCPALPDARGDPTRRCQVRSAPRARSVHDGGAGPSGSVRDRG